MNKFPYNAEQKAFQATDDAWQAELVRVFNKDAGQARYEQRGKGEPDSMLRKLHDAREKARIAWCQSAES